MSGNQVVEFPPKIASSMATNQTIDSIRNNAKYITISDIVASPNVVSNNNIPISSNSGNVRVTVEHTKDWWSFISEFVLIGGSLLALGYMFQNLLKVNDPEGSQKQSSEDQKKKLLTVMKQSGRSIKNFITNSYEDSLLSLVVLPHQIDVKFDDIGGLDNIKTDLLETVLFPLVNPGLTGTSRLCAPPLGVLFHGPPGTGKSMMAKAIAKESNATFFNIDMSRLMSKWYGDSQKYISALFSLARKMAPSIIWIDEIDALFSQRAHTDHSADVYNKALFLSLWDGLSGDISQNGKRNVAQVMVLGATNRAHEVDPAFLRRMARQYEFLMPDEKSRKLILTKLLKCERLDSDINLEIIAQKTNYYSGSDLKEICKYAATIPLREYVRKCAQSKYSSHDYSHMNLYEFLLQTKSTTSNINLKNNDNISSNSGIFDKISQITSKFGISNNMTMDKLPNEYELRSINMQDFYEALQHIQATMTQHYLHKHKSRDSLFSQNYFSNLGSTSPSKLNNKIFKIDDKESELEKDQLVD